MSDIPTSQLEATIAALRTKCGLLEAQLDGYQRTLGNAIEREEKLREHLVNLIELSAQVLGCGELKGPRVALKNGLVAIRQALKGGEG